MSAPSCDVDERQGGHGVPPLQTRSNSFLKTFEGEGIQNLAAADPTAPRHSNSISKIVQGAGRVSVDRNHEFNLPFARLANPPWLKIQPIGIGIDFYCGS